MEKKNLVLITGIALIVLMAVSVIAFNWPWCCSTGKITTNFVGPYKVYEGKTKTVKIGKGSYNISVINVLSQENAILNVAGTEKELTKGISTVGNLQVKIISISDNFWSTPSVKFSVAEAEDGTTSGSGSGNNLIDAFVYKFTESSLPAGAMAKPIPINLIISRDGNTKTYRGTYWDCIIKTKNGLTSAFTSLHGGENNPKLLGKLVGCQEYTSQIGSTGSYCMSKIITCGEIQPNRKPLINQQEEWIVIDSFSASEGLKAGTIEESQGLGTMKIMEDDSYIYGASNYLREK